MARGLLRGLLTTNGTKLALITCTTTLNCTTTCPLAIT